MDFLGRMAAPETVVAIDFGTTRSAWAYKVSGQAGDKILVKIPGSAVSAESSTAKTETVALIGGSGRGDLIKFGPTALEEYAASEHADDLALFRWFKLDLCESRPGETAVGSVMARPTKGKPVPLLGVMRASLLYFKKDVLKFLSRTAGRTIEASSVNWVLTVPAIYDDFAKRFMRQAAFEAGMIDSMNSTRLRLALEPEAALLAVITKDNPLTCEAEGKNTMIIDCGGGTVDITAHEIVSVDPLKLEEVAAPNGGLFGSTRVDEAFKGWLRTFLGDWFDEIETTGTLVSIMMAWESKKATFEGQDSATALLLKLSDLAELGVTKQVMETLRTRYNDGQPSSKRVGGKLFNVTLPTTLVASFFTPTLKKIAECLRRIKRESSLSKFHRVFVVGGFSRSPLLREVVRAELDQPGCRVVEVHEPDVAIVKGAVMYFDRSTVFNSRKARLTYGTMLSVPFDGSSEHQRRREAGLTLENDRNKTFISGSFNVFIEKGDDLPFGGVSKRLGQIPFYEDQRRSTVVVYASSEKNPRFVDEESCFEIGRVSFDLDMNKDFEERGYRVEFTFGGPELTVKILHETEERQITEAVMVMKRAPQPSLRPAPYR